MRIHSSLFADSDIAERIHNGEFADGLEAYTELVARLSREPLLRNRGGARYFLIGETQRIDPNLDGYQVLVSTDPEITVLQVAKRCTYVEVTVPEGSSCSTYKCYISE